MIEGSTPVRGDQRGVRGGFLLGFDDRSRSLPEEVGSVGATRRSDPIQFGDQFVIELDEHLTPGHDHMLAHMVMLTPDSTLGSAQKQSVRSSLKPRSVAGPSPACR